MILSVSAMKGSVASVRILTLVSVVGVHVVGFSEMKWTLRIGTWFWWSKDWDAVVVPATPGFYILSKTRLRKLKFITFAITSAVSRLP
jgi:hypothetical protein